MGRWAEYQRRASTGQPPTIPPVVAILQVHDPGALLGQLLCTFDGPITAALFTPGLFSEDNLGQPADTVAQSGPNALLYSAAAWLGIPMAGDTWTYTDTVPNVLTPQTGTIT